MEDAESWLALARMPALHAGVIAQWLESGRTPIEWLDACRTSAARGRSGVDAAGPFRPADPAGIATDLAWLRAAPDRHLVTWGSAAYPTLLARIADAPLVLFVEGKPSVLAQPQLAIVGSRHPTSLGRDTAADFAAHLARAGLAVTSGLALGIDAAAHRGALGAGGPTVAVLGCGLDRVYPPENASLAREIVAQGGALVSDFPVGTPPLKPNFPRRNRLLSGLAVGTLVVEAALRSGSLITARLAADQGREVFAIPGSIHNAVARGCHRLLRDGARLVESAQDIFDELHPILGISPKIATAHAASRPDAALPSLDKEYEILLDALGFEPAGLDAIVARTGFAAGAVASMLLILELDGRIQQQPGGRYCRRLPGR